MKEMNNYITTSLSIQNYNAIDKILFNSDLLIISRYSNYLS